tara:strand:+ start:1995 stop:2168 length:174 start_codon:yes stop_codon:yes gene_type:complete
LSYDRPDAALAIVDAVQVAHVGMRVYIERRPKRRMKRSGRDNNALRTQPDLLIKVVR